MKFEHEKTNEILKWFTEISKIPRCSKNEEKIAQWLVDWAKQHNFAVKTDKVRNLVIKIPATAGFEKSTGVVIQGHMDMVCEKTPDSNHDFTRDPIKLVFDGDWLKADKTTLGADNGIAIAIGMTLALDKETEHPPLELFFTVDEETGLTGANALETGFIDGKILINVDSEDEGVFTVGCAGGI
ncbi:MAG: M20/M25/M40 family metallo-hydrolase, partial [Candidatus Aminicenantes bacterium]|nr:M20/M25/M40 family metallo-hydrolase [Candidatus Aminicenantes bacterium]